MAHQVSRGGATRDEWRSARLLFARELAAGEVGYSELARPEVLAAVRSRRLPGPVRRMRERLAQRRGRLDLERELYGPLMHARRAVLGDEAHGEPRILIRMDEFPHCLADDQPERYGAAAYERFHATMAEAGVPYLAAVLPRVARDPYDPAATGDRPLSDEERELIARMQADGVAFATHGFDHRTRHASPRRHSELCGLSEEETGALLDHAELELSAAGIAPRVFVPPYNRFDAAQYPALARRFDVVCGGPESIGQLGFHRGPLWRDDAVYFPSYGAFYGRSWEVVKAVERLAALEVPVWAQITLHWGWEARDGFRGLAQSVRRLAAFARPWDDFLAEVDASRDAAELGSATRALPSSARRRAGHRSRAVA